MDLEHKDDMKRLLFSLALSALPALMLAQVSRIELGWQTTSRGIVWYSSTPPTHEPYWQFSRDTNKVLWVDTVTSLRYDYSYNDNVWYTKGRASGAVPPLPQQVSGSTMLDNRTAFWIRDTFNLLHKYDSTAGAWVPFGDWFFLSTVPTDIAATASNGAAKYRQSLWQDADDNVLYYFDGSAWVQVGGDLSITNEIQTISATGAGPTQYDIELDLGGGAVTLAEGAGIDLTRSTNTITVANSGDLSSSNEIQTISGSGTAPTYAIDLSLSGGSVGIIQGTNMTITRSGNNFTFASSGGSGLTAADNGLNVVGTTVKLGGTLNQAGTSIECVSPNVFRWYGSGKWSVSSWTGFGIDPTNAKIGFSGLEVAPINTSTTGINGILEMAVNNSSGTVQSNQLSFGGYVTDADGMWIQSRSRSNPGFEYPLALQPNGGIMSVGRQHQSNLPDALVTIAGFGLTGTGASGSVLHLEHSEGHGNVPLTFGAGTDIVDAEVMWRDADDAFRVTNRNAIDNTSSIRFAIGGQTNDLAALVKSSNSISFAKFAVGVGSPSNIHSTIQSAGSIGCRCLTTVGSFTLDESNCWVIYTGSSSVTWTLPTASTVSGRMYVLASRGTGTVNLSASVSKGNSGNFNSLSAGQWAIIASDGSGWTGFKITSE